MTIKTNITDMFGLKHPVVNAPMGPFRTTELALAVEDAGGLGTISHTTVSMGGYEKTTLPAVG